eukprot:3721566-Prymnesium_polylepis.1
MSVDAWWTTFGDEYDPASPAVERTKAFAAEKADTAAAEAEEVEERVRGGATHRALLDEQLALNRKLAANLRAKTQLLELADEARGRMKAQVAASAAEHAAT